MTSNESTVVMNQIAASNVATQTPLHHAQLSTLVSSTAETDAGIVLKERDLSAQLMLRVRGDLVSGSMAVKSAIGIELPERLQFTGNPSNFDEVSLAWISPDEWRLCCPNKDAFEYEQKLRQALSSTADTTHAVVNNSGGFTVLEISGPEVLNLLKKSTAYDLRAVSFPVGKVVGTSFAKTTVTLLRTGEQSWQVWARRSFSDYVWLWLQNASREYGLKIIQ